MTLDESTRLDALAGAVGRLAAIAMEVSIVIGANADTDEAKNQKSRRLEELKREAEAIVAGGP